MRNKKKLKYKMEFHKYHSIENTYRIKFVEQIKLNPEQDWIVTEKVHGANFSFLITEK